MIKILTIDDEQGICFLIKSAFEPIGFIVLSANNGADALSVVRKERPKLIFLDILMSGIPGLEVLREIKAFDPTIKVVMLTSVKDEASRAKAKELGADDFVTKPFMSDHLEEVARKEIADIRKERQVQQAKILVVDDEEIIREKLSKIIARHFFCEVDIAANGQEALDKLRAKKIDLVVLDIRMPGLSGIDVLHEAAKFTPDTKFLAVSGYDSSEIADEALKAGAVDFLHKPQTAEGVLRKVKEILKKMGKYEPKGP